jgi:hypothetical protein
LKLFYTSRELKNSKFWLECMLLPACETGDLELFQYVWRKLTDFGYERNLLSTVILLEAAKFGRLDILLFAVRKYKNYAPALVITAAHNAAANGHLAVLQYLVSKFNLSARHFFIPNVTPPSFEVRVLCCANGHLETLQFITNVCGKSKHARKHGAPPSYLILECICNNHNVLLQWLLVTLKFTYDQQVYEEFMYEAARGGHVSILETLDCWRKFAQQPTLFAFGDDITVVLPWVNLILSGSLCNLPAAEWFMEQFLKEQFPFPGYRYNTYLVWWDQIEFFQVPKRLRVNWITYTLAEAQGYDEDDYLFSGLGERFSSAVRLQDVDFVHFWIEHILPKSAVKWSRSEKQQFEKALWTQFRVMSNELSQSDKCALNASELFKMQHLHEHTLLYVV